MGLACYKCGKDTGLEIGQKISFKETCLHCVQDLHSCKACGFYDPKSYNECREPSADRIVDKEKNNFCDFFNLTDSKNNSDSSKEDLLAKANALFKS